jgi:aspartate aminotransferase
MVNEKMRALGATRSVIRETFEYGKRRKSEIGEENVFDFSIGNPSVPSPDAVNESLIKLLTDTDPVALHGYTSAQGDAGVRKALSEYINKTYGDSTSAADFYLTVGAAASLTVSLTAILNEGDEVILIAPFFPEYRVFVERTGARAVAVDSEAGSFQPDIQKLEEAFTEKTRAVIVNYPNNPTGAVITEEKAKAIGELVFRMSEKYGKPVYLVSDEPYRELVYDGITVPYLSK